MKLQQLRQFVMLAETRNFHRAAGRLNMAQPPLSISIRKLEAELGAALFVRSQQGVYLTAEGEAALADARQALFHAEQFQHAVRETHAGERGGLRVGFVGSATYRLLPRLLRAYRERHPLVDVTLAESRTADLLADVEAGAIDVAIVRTPIMGGAAADIAVIETDRLCVATAKHSRFAGRKRAQLAEFRDEAFVIYSRESVPGMYALTMLACQQAGFVPRIAEQASQLQTIICLVESGLGVALVPSVIAEHARGVDFIAIAGEVGQGRIGLGITLRASRPSVAAVRFRDFALEHVAPDTI
jgi:DNA-binding transcriptional LysR family regulator